MTAESIDPPPRPGGEPHRDIQSLIRATHPALCQIAFRRLCNYADAEDAVQMACIKVHRRWATVEGLATARQQHAYLIRTVINETLQMLRDPQRDWEVFEVGEAERGWMPDFPGGRGQPAKDHLRCVWRAISELPEGNREVVVLFATGYEYCEIAAMLGITESAVRSHISSARKRLPRAPSAGREEDSHE
jgi:RNA polymerase sigma factor (sigma-70 family)